MLSCDYLEGQLILRNVHTLWVYHPSGFRLSGSEGCQHCLSHTCSIYSRSSFMLWLGPSLFLEISCCARFISMPKPLRVHTAGLLFPPAMSPVSSHACDCQQFTHFFVVHGRSDASWPPSGLGTHTEKSCIILKVPLPTEGPCYVICGECCTSHRQNCKHRLGLGGLHDGKE